MYSTNSHNLPALIYSVDGELDFLPNDIPCNDIDLDFEPAYFRNFPSYPLNHDNFSSSIVSMKDEHPFPSRDEIIPILQGPSSKDSSSELSNILISTESNSALPEEDGNFIGRKRSKERKPRMYNSDDMRIKLKRGFLNDYLKKLSNDTLRNIGSRKYFEKFPKFFASDVCKKRNENIVDMTIGEIFENKEIYANENEKGWQNYWHNLKVLQSDEIRGNEEIQKILNKTFRQLYEEYINSNAFKIDEINRLKSKNKKDDYIQKYKVVAKQLIQFFKN